MAADPLWYKDAVIYELRVRSFFDGNGDGIGDLAGLTSRLDYLADLGVNALWLLPFYPSPLRDDGYDIESYVDVHAELGTLAEFKEFLRQAHRRGLRVITELVLNHTSDRHPWFQRARAAPAGGKARDYYIWSDDPRRFAQARIIFKDFESSNWAWDPVANAYYWHRFYSHQPDLNFHNPVVRKEMLKVVDFWLKMGVDGLRLDAVPYLFEREGTSCENLPETHTFLQELRKYVDDHYEDRMLLAEANQWPEDAAAYFGTGDECHMAFHFPIMPRLYMALRMENSFPIIDILQQTPSIPGACQWAIFLRNHDELTLEMVTDEERDYLVRAYARDRRARINLGIRRRLAPLLDNNRRRLELMTALLLSLPGTPVIYYGDELGMGDNVYLGDRDGVRTPMHWTPDRNAGFSQANPQKLILPVITDPEYHYQAVNVETQHDNPSSLLWWMRRIIALRKQFRAFGRGSFEPLRPSNHRVLAYIRRHESSTLLVVANLSRFPQHVSLDLSQYAEYGVREMFGRVKFPAVTKAPYLLTLGPHGFFWFELTAASASTGLSVAPPVPVVYVEEDPADLPRLLTEGHSEALGAALLAYIRRCRWFRGKARTATQATVLAAAPLQSAHAEIALAFVRVTYTEGDPDIYLLPVLLVADTFGPTSLICEVARAGREDARSRFLAEVSDAPELAATLLELVASRGRLATDELLISAQLEKGAHKLLPDPISAAGARRVTTEQSNTTWMFGDKVVAKLVRKVEDGLSPEVELGRHLSNNAHFRHAPRLVGHIEAVVPQSEPATLLVVQELIANHGDTWRLVLDDLSRHFEAVRALPAEPHVVSGPAVDDAIALAFAPQDLVNAAHVGPLTRMMTLLGQRVGDLHAALASPSPDAVLAPEPFTPFFQRALYQSLRNLAIGVLTTLESRVDALPPSLRGNALHLVASRDAVLDRFRVLVGAPFGGKRIRCHGDLHLGQILWTGDDVVFIDFEGEPARALGDRKTKRSPLTDVAGMLRSFDYAVEKAVTGQLQGSSLRPGDEKSLRPWARRWLVAASAMFLRSYLERVKGAELVPSDPSQLASLLRVYVLEKALYEVGYEANHRPEWIDVPLRGVLALLGRDREGHS